MTKSRFTFIAFGLLALVACEDPYTPTPRPDYTIRVVPTTQQGPSQGSIAVPPTCPSWNTEVVDPYDDQPLPQFGCADARNLALMIDNPNDLVKGRPLGEARGVQAVGTIRRYDNNQPRGLIMPGADGSSAAITTAPTASSTLSGDETGGKASGGLLSSSK